MNPQELDKLAQTVRVLDDIAGTLYCEFAGKPLTEEKFAAVISKYVSEIPFDDLKADCNHLRNGIQQGTAQFDELMQLSEEERELYLPCQLKHELEQMPDEQKHPYLMLLYQFLSQIAGHDVCAEEAVYVSNISDAQLVQKISCLMQKGRVEIAREAAEFLHHSVHQMQTNVTYPQKESYTTEENAWIASAVVYIMVRRQAAENMPAAYIGTQIGFANACLSNYQESMLAQIVPAAMSVLAAWGIAVLLFFCFRLLLAGTLFLTAISFLKSSGNFKILLAGAICLLGKLLAFVTDTVFTEVTLLICSLERDNAQTLFEERFAETDDLTTEEASERFDLAGDAIQADSLQNPLVLGEIVQNLE